MFALLAIPIILFVIFQLISQYNLFQLSPTKSELKTIKYHFGDISINDEEDIIRIQNKSFELMKFDGQGLSHHQEIRVDSLFKWKRALCFHRSLLLQKIFLYNHIDVIPVFLFYNKKVPSKTSFFDILDRDLQSHNVFLAQFKGKSYLIKVNQPMSKMITLDQYMKETLLPKGTKYLKHLNNRHGIYLYPSWLPDIY